ncbi:MAG: alpha/beta hydrolase [Candidatus Planktophila sp.]|nr:alpha/beta hydrolase [Candidatus Planktophila sp.]
MKSFFSSSFAIFLLAQLAGSPAVGQELLQLKRDDSKSVRAMVYKPSISECKGIAIISHGAGGSEKGYNYLGSAMSSFGYLTVVVGHQESGLQAVQEQISGNSLGEGLAKLITNSAAYQGRFKDIAVAKGWAQSQCNTKIEVLIGHSMGAATVMMAAGARNKLEISEGPKFTAYIAISPQGSGLIFPVNAWSDIDQPVLMLTGTQDKELGGVSWETRTQPYQNMKTGCKWLGVIDGATHMNFAGRGLSKKTEILTTQIIREFLTGVQASDCKTVSQLSGMTVSVK